MSDIAAVLYLTLGALIGGALWQATVHLWNRRYKAHDSAIVGKSPCPDCAAVVHEQHDLNCDVARCLISGRQRLTCHADHDCGSDQWTGEWPGIEARVNG